MSAAELLSFLLLPLVVLFGAKEFFPSDQAKHQKNTKKCLFEAGCIGYPESFVGLRSKPVFSPLYRAKSR